MNRSGRIERSVEAHKGAVLVGQWGNDGTGLLTGEYYLHIENVLFKMVFGLFSYFDPKLSNKYFYGPMIFKSPYKAYHCLKIEHFQSSVILFLNELDA